MNDVNELFLKIAKWRGNSNTVIPENELNRVEENYKEIFERDFLKRGRSLLLRYKEMEGKIRNLLAELVVLKAQLDGMQNEMKITVDLDSGEKVVFDMSGSHRVIAFWQEIKKNLDEEISIQEKSIPKGLYNPALLSQESDDLLKYL